MGAAPPQQDYYALLGVCPDATPQEIRAAYRKLALRWHPDRLGKRSPWLAAEAKRRFQDILEAYQVLSDQRKRRLYDAGVYGALVEEGDEEVEGFADFVQEMMRLMADVRREEKQYSLEDLRRMLGEMAQGFQDLDAAPSLAANNSSVPRSHKRTRCDAEQTAGGRRSRLHVSGLEVYGGMSYC